METKKTWDKVNSTYWWKLYLLPEFDRRRNAGPDNPLIGYSQSEGWAECQDKHQLIKNKIINPFVKSDYLNRCSKVEVYKRTGFYINGSSDLLVLELYKNDFCLHAQAYGNKSGELVVWLKKLYDDILQGKKHEYILTPKKINYSVNLDKRLDPSSYPLIRSNGDLQAQCQRLIACGINREQVLHFYRKMTEKMER